jgi:molybdopterin-containing oxidoreductase family iron-sulfur binding subunit
VSKHNRPQPQDKGKNGSPEQSVSRRNFLKKSLGALAGLGLLAVPAVPLLKKAYAADTSGTVAGPDTIRRNWCMVVDLKRCDGCTGLDIPPQCTQACVNGHYVPEGMKWIEVFTQDLPGGGSYFQPTPCFHCENAPCVNVCPVGATYHTEEGIVLVDQRRCIGCRMCMAACPYHRRFFNWGVPELPPEATFMEYSPEHQSPAYKGTVMKCDFCPDMMKNGTLPYCVTGCPRKVLYMGDLSSDLASNGKEVVVLSDLLNKGSAYRYKEELGTQPRVFFLPGYGQDQGRDPADRKALLPTTWAWGGVGYDHRLPFGQWEFKK